MSKTRLYCGWVPVGNLTPFCGMVPFETPCASCASSIVIRPEQIEEIHLRGCNCIMFPYVCESCRNKNDGKPLQCKFCLRQGTTLNYRRMRYLDPSLTRDWARTWSDFRRTYKQVKYPLFQMILNNWNLSYYCHGIISHENLSPFWNESILKKMFFESWLAANLFQKRGKISICYDRTMVSSHFLRMFRNVSFARLLIRNLFGGCRNTRRLMAAIHARILANFQILFEILLKLK